MFARLFILFITVPLIELFLFLVIGQKIGIVATFAIILLTGFLGGAWARSQGLRAFAKYREAIAQGRVPHDAVLEGILILVAGALLLTPGFLTDTIGFLLLVPRIRVLARDRIEESLRDRFRFVGVTSPGQNGAKAGNTNGPAGFITVEAEVVESVPDRQGTNRS